MATETLKINITADNKAAVAAFGQVQKSAFNLKEELLKYQSLAFTEKDQAKVQAYNRRIQELTVQLKQATNVGKQGFDQMGNAIKGGSGAINKAFTGLRQIAYIVPGLGLAGIFNLAFEAIGKAANALGVFNDKAKEAQKEQEKFREGLDKEAASAIKTGFELNAYLSIARNTSKSMAERNEALKKANELYGDHNEKLSLANINTKAVKEQVEGYTQALISNAIAAKYGDKLAELYMKQRTAARLYGEELEKLKKLEPGYRSGMANNGGLDISEGGATQNSAVRAYEIQLSKTIEATNKYKDATKELSVVSGDYLNVLEKSNELNSKYNQTHEKETKAVKEKAKAYNELDEYLKLYYKMVALGAGANPILQPKSKATELGKPVTRLARGENGSGIFDEDFGNIASKRKSDLDELNKSLAMSAHFANMGAEAFNSMFNAMANGEGIGEAIANVFKDLVKQLALSVAKAITFAVILNVISGGAYSIGKIFTGALGGNFTGKGYAKGGLSTGPTSGHMELLHGNEWVLRPEQLSGALSAARAMGSMSGSGMGTQTIEVVGKIAGQDIWLSKQRTDYNRGLTT